MKIKINGCDSSETISSIGGKIDFNQPIFLPKDVDWAKRAVELTEENEKLRFENCELCMKILAVECGSALQKAIGKHSNDFKSITVNEKKRIVTVVFADGDVRMSKCNKSDQFDVAVGVALCVAQHLFGSKTNFHKKIEKVAKYVGGKKSERKKQ
nr:MAG TPA: hypothetical protein [Caudoviricetes sp.]